MALIKKIREKSGIAVGLVALGLGLFIVGGDILGPDSMLLGQSKRDVGVIAGEKISIDDFNRQFEELRYNFMLNTQRNPSESELNMLRQQAWDFLIVKTAFQKEYDRLGIAVTDQELVDMVQGRNIRPEIEQAFTNPETGELNRSDITAYLRTIRSRPPQEQSAWFQFESTLKPSRLRIKYDNLLIKSSYVTTAEAKKAYDYENSIAEVRYLYVPYYSINDSLVHVTDRELQAYIRNNREQFQVEESRNARYVQFPFVASKEDTASIKQELLELMEEFRRTEEDSIFARINTDGFEGYGKYSVAELPEPLKANISNLSEGDVRGPYLSDGRYALYKVSEIGTDTIFSARASHILIRPKEQTDAGKSTARSEAQRILNELMGGASFAEMARQHSDDPSRTRGGDLGWFETGRMVQPFEDAVFGARTTGLINRLIETEYGFHIINVTETKNNRAFYLATIERAVIPSDQTRNEAYRRADRFANTIGNLREFMQVAENESLAVLTADDIRKNDRRVNTLADARNVVMWLYNEASQGQVSPVFELEDVYVVVALADKIDAGVASLDQVRDRVTMLVKNEKKANIIKDKLKEHTGTLDEIASAYGPDANIYTSSSLRFNSNILPTVGAAPEAIGKIFSLEEGDRTDSVITDNGIVIVELVALTEAPALADVSTYQNQVLQRQTGATSYYLSEAIKEFSDIEDNRVRFF
jgi:peptidyl-prolyl cis-trans isomerase D